MFILGYALSFPGAANLSFIVLSLSDPAGVLALILAHKKYRRAVIRLFYKGISILKQFILFLEKIKCLSLETRAISSM